MHAILQKALQSLFRKVFNNQFSIQESSLGSLFPILHWQELNSQNEGAFVTIQVDDTLKLENKESRVEFKKQVRGNNVPPKRIKVHIPAVSIYTKITFKICGAKLHDVENGVLAVLAGIQYSHPEYLQKYDSQPRKDQEALSLFDTITVEEVQDFIIRLSLQSLEIQDLQRFNTTPLEYYLSAKCEICMEIESKKNADQGIINSIAIEEAVYKGSLFESEKMCAISQGKATTLSLEYDQVRGGFCLTSFSGFTRSTKSICSSQKEVYIGLNDQGKIIEVTSFSGLVGIMLESKVEGMFPLLKDTTIIDTLTITQTQDRLCFSCPKPENTTCVICKIGESIQMEYYTRSGKYSQYVLSGLEISLPASAWEYPIGSIYIFQGDFK